PAMQHGKPPGRIAVTFRPFVRLCEYGWAFSPAWEAGMSTWSRGRLALVALLVVLVELFAPGRPAGRPSEAAPATLVPQATAQRGAGRVGQSPTLLGDINNDGIVDIRDYGLWRQNFGQTNCGNVADLNVDCIVDIRDYGIWRAQFGQTGPTVTPT